MRQMFLKVMRQGKVVPSELYISPRGVSEIISKAIPQILSWTGQTTGLRFAFSPGFSLLLGNRLGKLRGLSCIIRIARALYFCYSLLVCSAHLHLFAIPGC